MSEFAGPKRFEIHENDAGTEAYCDMYVMHLQAENERLREWVNDLHSGMYVNCVYCGHRYGPCEDTPVAMADVLREHIEQCPSHPLSQAIAERDTLRSERLHQLESLRSALRGIRREFGYKTINYGTSTLGLFIDAVLANDTKYAEQLRTENEKL